MMRAYKFLLRPTARQEQALAGMPADHCSLYNGALGVGHVRVHRHRPVRGRVRTISVKREGRRWYVVLTCDDVLAEPLPATGSSVGIDMGVRHVLTTSDGEHAENPRFLQVMTEEPAAAQQHLATFPKRTRQRTKRHRAAARKVAKLHAKIRRQRLDHHHKAANTLVAGHDVIVHEKLNTAGMTRSPAARPDPETKGVVSNLAMQVAGTPTFLSTAERQGSPELLAPYFGLTRRRLSEGSGEED